MLTTTSIVTLMYTAGTQHRANSTSLHEQSYHTSFFSFSIAINGVEFYNLGGLSPKQISFHPVATILVLSFERKETSHS